MRFVYIIWKRSGLLNNTEYYDRLGVDKNASQDDIKKAFDSIDRDILKNMIENDFVSDQKEILLSFIKIYNSIEVDILGEKISPTKGGPQGSSIIPILFCYYLDKCINKIKLRENITLRAYADDIIIKATSIEDLKDTYKNIKENIFSKIGIASFDKNTNEIIIIGIKNVRHLAISAFTL